LTTATLVARFEPSADRGEALDRRMRERLAGSLDYMFAAVGEALGLDVAACSDLTARIRSGPQSPHIFGAYYDLVIALERDELDVVRELANEMVGQRSAAGTRIAAIDDRPANEEERYRRQFLANLDVEIPPSELMAEYRRRLDDAFSLLDAGYPEMASEIRALLRDIVVAAGPEDPKALTFDGASCYMLWGAIMLNARGQKTVLDAVQALAHESGHNLLFGFSTDGPLVENADDELFSSPLRKDPRPMDGVFHATYVVARMHQTLSRLLDPGVLDSAHAEAARADLALHRRNFEIGDQVVREGGRLTAVGREVIEAAREYMASAA
jgi:HEXXH motif-containing protein